MYSVMRVLIALFVVTSTGGVTMKLPHSFIKSNHNNKNNNNNIIDKSSPLRRSKVLDSSDSSSFTLSSDYNEIYDEEDEDDWVITE